MLSSLTVRAAPSLAESKYCVSVKLSSSLCTYSSSASALASLSSATMPLGQRRPEGKFAAEARRFTKMDRTTPSEVEAELEMYDQAIPDFTGRQLPVSVIVRIYQNEVYTRSS